MQKKILWLYIKLLLHFCTISYYNLLKLFLLWSLFKIKKSSRDFKIELKECILLLTWIEVFKSIEQFGVRRTTQNCYRYVRNNSYRHYVKKLEFPKPYNLSLRCESTSYMNLFLDWSRWTGQQAKRYGLYGLFS